MFFYKKCFKKLDQKKRHNFTYLMSKGSLMQSAAVKFTFNVILLVIQYSTICLLNLKNKIIQTKNITYFQVLLINAKADNYGQI